MRHFLVRRRAVIGEDAIAARDDALLFATCPIARMNAASSASEAFAEKSSTETYSPFGMMTMWVGACGLMSRKASTCSSS